MPAAPFTRIAALAVLRNPFADSGQQDLQALADVGATRGHARPPRSWWRRVLHRRAAARP